MTDILITKKNVVLDATVLTTLMRCPRETDFSFNHNFQPISGKSNSLECGSIVHTFMENYYGNIIKGISRKQAEGFAFAAAQLYITGCPHCTNYIPSPETIRPSCGHSINQFPGVHNTPKEPDLSIPTEKYKTGWAWVLDTCQQYVDYYKNDHWVPIEVEVVKGKVLYEDEEIRILWKAKLDTIFDTNQGIFATDHKTMKQNRQTNSMNNQFMGQCLIMESSQIIINKVGFQKTLPPEEKFKREPVGYLTERLIEWQSNILPYYAKLLLMYNEGEYFPPNLESCERKYGKCQYKTEICEASPDMREENFRLNFVIGPEWNPTNESYDNED